MVDMTFCDSCHGYTKEINNYPQEEHEEYLNEILICH